MNQLIDELNQVLEEIPKYGNSNSFKKIIELFSRYSTLLSSMVPRFNVSPYFEALHILSAETRIIKSETTSISQKRDSFNRIKDRMVNDLSALIILITE